MKRINSSINNNIVQSHVLEHQLRDNPIYARTAAHEHIQLDNCNSLHQHHHHHHQPQPPAAHSYEKLDHVVINPCTSSATNLLTVTTTPAAVTSPDVVNTMGYLVASQTSREQLGRPIIIWAPTSHAANMAELNVVTDQHGRQCCCASASGLPSTATSGGGYMKCDTRTRNHVIGGEESRDRHHITGGAECRDSWLRTNQRPYTTMSHGHNRLSDCNISAL